MSLIKYIIILSVVLIMAGGVMAGNEKNSCREICLDKIDINQCIDDEIEYWDKIDKKEAIESCKILIREYHEDCLRECSKNNGRRKI